MKTNRTLYKITMRWNIKICIFKFFWYAHPWFTVKFWGQKSPPFWNGDGFFRRRSAIPRQVSFRSPSPPKNCPSEVLVDWKSWKWFRRAKPIIGSDLLAAVNPAAAAAAVKNHFAQLFFSKKSNISKSANSTRKVLYIKLKLRPKRIYWYPFQRATRIKANFRRRKRFFSCALWACPCVHRMLTACVFL